MTWQHHVQQAWQQRGLLAGALWPAQLLSRAFVRRRQRQARQHTRTRHAVPVVVVGNVIVGGAGKTPTTLALAKGLKLAGESPVIISKGYGRQGSHEAHEVVSVDSQVQTVGDEPLLMAQAHVCPVVVTRDRASSITWVLNRWPKTSVLLFDDGLQDHHLHADVEVLLFDARGVGNGWLLPAGPLRESWPRRSWRAGAKQFHLLSLGAHETAPALDTLQGPLWISTRQVQPHMTRLDEWVTTSIEKLSSQPCQAIAGIAKPHQFFAMLRSQGLQLTRTHACADHAPLAHAYRRLTPELPVVMTAKDAVKCQDWPADWQARTWVVHLNVELPLGFLQATLDALRQWRITLSSTHGQNTD